MTKPARDTKPPNHTRRTRHTNGTPRERENTHITTRIDHKDARAPARATRGHTATWAGLRACEHQARLRARGTPREPARVGVRIPGVDGARTPVGRSTGTPVGSTGTPHPGVEVVGVHFLRPVRTPESRVARIAHTIQWGSPARSPPPCAAPGHLSSGPAHLHGTRGSGRAHAATRAGMGEGGG